MAPQFTQQTVYCLINPLEVARWRSRTTTNHRQTSFYRAQFYLNPRCAPDQVYCPALSATARINGVPFRAVNRYHRGFSCFGRESHEVSNRVAYFERIKLIEGTWAHSYLIALTCLYPALPVYNVKTTWQLMSADYLMTGLNYSAVCNVTITAAGK